MPLCFWWFLQTWSVLSLHLLQTNVSAPCHYIHLHPVYTLPIELLQTLKRENPHGNLGFVDYLLWRHLPMLPAQLMCPKAQRPMLSCMVLRRSRMPARKKG